jgi:hypothetical protein
MRGFENMSTTVVREVIDMVKEHLGSAMASFCGWPW